MCGLYHGTNRRDMASATTARFFFFHASSAVTADVCARSKFYSFLLRTSPSAPPSAVLPFTSLYSGSALYTLTKCTLHTSRVPDHSVLVAMAASPASKYYCTVPSLLKITLLPRAITRWIFYSMIARSSLYENSVGLHRKRKLSRRP